MNNTVSIIKLSRYLGRELQNSKLYIDYKNTVTKKDNDEDLQKLICEYNLKKISLDMQGEKENCDKNKLKRLNDEIKMCYNKIKDNANMQNFEKKKATMKNFIDNLINIIVDYVE